MAENTLQYEWLVRLKGGIEAHCADAFVAGDLLWYYAEGDPTQCVAPDVMVAFGRPRGERMTYLQWEEKGVVPQVVVELWSPTNSWPERARKLMLYERLGVEEFITYDLNANLFCAFVRSPLGVLAEVEGASTLGWVSPRLGIRFVPDARELGVFGSDGKPLRFFGELVEDVKRAEAAKADAEAARADAEARIELLTAQLRALGATPK